MVLHFSHFLIKQLWMYIYLCILIWLLNSRRHEKCWWTVFVSFRSLKMGSWERGANVTIVTSRWFMDKGLNSDVFPYESALIRAFDWSLSKHHLTDYLPPGSSQRGIKWRDICPGRITNITMFPADCHTHTSRTARWHGCTRRLCSAEIVCNDLRLECVE